MSWARLCQRVPRDARSFGAIIADPAGSTHINLDGSASSLAGLQLDIHNSAGSFREMVLLGASNDRKFTRSIMDYYNIMHEGRDVHQRQQLPGREEHRT